MAEHPIAPPTELVQHWLYAASSVPASLTTDLGGRRDHIDYIATEAARWGADQELEACCEWLNRELGTGWGYGTRIRAARRPKPPSLKEQALQAAQRFYAKGHENCTDEEVKDDFDTIRRALEQLDD